MKNFRQSTLKGLFTGLFMLLWQFSFGQVIFTSTPDSLAYLNEAYSYNVTVTAAPDAPTFSLPTKPAGMTINPSSGVVSWTPTDINAGGKVVVQATNSYGTYYQTYYIYLSDAVVCDTSLVSYWSMDNQNQDTVLYDYANGHDAKWSGPTQPQPTLSTDAMVDHSVLFSPTSVDDEFYTVPDETPFQIDTGGEFSVSFWFKNQPLNPTVTPFKEVMISRYTTGGKWSISYDNNPYDTLYYQKIIFDVEDNGTDDTLAVSSSTYADTLWHHVVATFHSQTGTAVSYLFLYIDKQKIMVTHDYYTDTYAGTGALDIGWSSQGGQAYTGYLDEIAYYKKELLQPDVDSLYNKGINGQTLCHPGNIAPLIKSAADTTATENVKYSYTLNYSELDAGDVVTLFAPVLPSWLSFNPSTQVLSGTPNNNNVGDTTVTLSVSDGIDTVSQTFNLHVANVNDAPILNGIESSALAYTEGDAAKIITASIMASDSDNVNLQSATVSITGNFVSTEDALQFTNQNGISGSFSSSTGILTLTGSSSVANYQAALRSVKYYNSNNNKPSVLTRTISFTVNDGALNSDTLTRNITVTGVNDPPVINSQNAVSTNEDVSVVIGFSDLNVTDVDNVYPTDFTLTVKNGPNYSHTGNTVTPDLNWNGTLKVAYDLSDGTNIVSDTLDVTVIPVNDPPVITSTAQTDAYAEQAYLYILGVSDPDVGDILTDTLVKGPSWMTLIAQGGNYVLTGTPNYADVGADSVVVAVHDSSYAYAYQKFVVTVHNPNHIPQFTSTPVTAVNEDTPYTYNIAVSDSDAADVPNLAVSAVEIPSWLTLNGLTLSGTPTNAQVGYKPDSTYHVVLSVTDTKQSSTQSFDITVTNVNDAPVISNIESSAIAYKEGDAAVNITSTLTVSDVDNVNLQSATVSIENNYISTEDTLQFSDQNGITGSFSSGTLTLTGSSSVANYQTALRSVKYYNSNNGNPSQLTRTIAITVNDGALNSDTATRSITVAGVNDAPVIESQVTSLTKKAGDSFTISLSDLQVTDVDNPPTDFSLVIDSGTGYTVSGNTVTIDSGVANGTLTINVQVSDGITESAVFAFEVTIQNPSGINNVISDNNLVKNLYPNPASTYITLELNTNKVVTIQIMDITGKVVFQKVYNDYSKNININVSNFVNGLYQYKLTTDNAYQFGKILIQR